MFTAIPASCEEGGISGGLSVCIWSFFADFGGLERWFMIAVCDPIMEERMPRQAMRKRLNASGLLALSRQCFEQIEDGTPVQRLSSGRLFDVGFGDVRSEVPVVAAV